ncbi:cysteine hydrolase family protein [Aeromicrobium duanguangcaii]|uniref:Cysteine hydrolase n=1 Tax=Aeromicrobium duanguangcaii TaxID=2968086 RepID=A0ABY5KBT6_9ACTN|nr:isochorismatase family cysteine hydrolase [Aeromicrobium duanguangcaii]MCD9154833.1 cysteine hydrolase [Aeromicrobium duanguangcaii]MCL3838961.1 cysteine hydrolase [Aeromicrobium duanguangcaii]UUI67754.1 cysteine hydrolase [Aeromicrobium duanguangcaii]
MRALIVIDLQEDFLNPPPLREQRSAIVRSVQEWTDWARRSDVPIVEVRTVLPQDKSTWALNMREDDQPVVLERTQGAELLAELDLRPDVTILKRRDDAFHGTDLLERLHELDVDELVIAGVVTEACIAMTAASAYANDFLVWIAEGAVTSADEKAHRAALLWLKEQYRQEVVSPEELEQRGSDWM